MTNKAMDSNTANDAAEARHPEIARERLERRTIEIDQRIGEMREVERRLPDETPGDYQKRHHSWVDEWNALWEERRASARQIAELSPMSVGDSLDAAVAALRRESASAALLGDHAGGNPNYSRRSIALETTARVLENVDPIAFARLASAALDQDER